MFHNEIEKSCYKYKVKLKNSQYNYDKLRILRSTINDDRH